MILSNNFKYPKGSLWRKWDLQVCTKHYSNYSGPSFNAEQISLLNTLTGLDKAAIQSDHKTLTDEQYAKLFVEYLVHLSDVDVVAIANHNTGKGIQAILDYLNTKKSQSDKYQRLHILPGVEIGATDGCHIVVIFEPSFEGKNKFEFDQQGKPTKEYSWDDYIERFLDIIGVPSQRFENNKPANTRTTTTEQILDLHDAWGFVPVFPHIKEKNGWYGALAESNRKATYAHGCFGIVDTRNCAGNTDLIEILNGNKKEFGSKKIAKINTSDSKSLTEIGKYFTWIKADPTCEGLKQIIYEPEERVKICGDSPESKKTYFTIDKVRFIDNSKPPRFSGDFIEINPNMTSMVGGKSTGKSLLLHYIARTIDGEETDKRVNESASIAPYTLHDEPNFDFEVVWADQEITRLKSTPQYGQTKRKILYIPQNYLNTLTEINIKSRSALNEFVLVSLLQDEVIKDKYNKSMQEMKTVAKSIPSKVMGLFVIFEEIQQIEEALKQLGDKKGIEKYIVQLQQEIDEIKSKSGLTPIEIESYETLSKQQQTLETELANLNADQETLTKLQTEILSAGENVIAIKDEYEGYVNTPIILQKVKEHFKFVNDFKAAVDPATKAVNDVITAQIKTRKDSLETLNKSLAPLIAKAALQKQLEQKGKIIKSEQDKLNKIALKKKELGIKKESHETSLKDLLDEYKKIFDAHRTLIAEFKKYESQFKDISVSATLGFDDASFNEEFIDQFVKKSDLKKIESISWKEDNGYVFDPSKHIDVVSKIFEGLLNGNIKTIKSKTSRDAITKLFVNRFNFDFSIFYKQDPLDKMSPGKKGIVLLRILIELSKEEWPVLLDQPEDDLDSRSIYNELAMFIKSKKKERQIILVTHNPNLVVGADSEEVIVANQDGQEVGRDNKKHQFEYVSGALENSFEFSETLEKAILFRKGIRQHVYEILEGGKEAFQKREQKYAIADLD